MPIRCAVLLSDAIAKAWLGVGIVFVSMFLRIYYQQKNKSAKKAAKAPKPANG